MSRSKKILDAPKKIREKLKDFNEERKKPKEPITTKASMFSIFSWAFYDLGNTIFSVLIVSFYFSLCYCLSCISFYAMLVYVVAF